MPFHLPFSKLLVPSLAASTMLIVGLPGAVEAQPAATSEPILVLESSTSANAGSDRGGSPEIKYTVKNVGTASAAPGTRLAVRLPEGLKCDAFTFTGGVQVQECVDGIAPGARDGLNSGDYALITIPQEIGANQKHDFSVIPKLPKNFGPRTIWSLDVGLVDYKDTKPVGDQKTYIARFNTYCRIRGGNQTQLVDSLDQTCAVAVVKALHNETIQTSELGNKYVLPQHPLPGNGSTFKNHRIITSTSTFSGVGDSSDKAQVDTPTDPARLTVTPGEKGVYTINLFPPKAAANSGPEAEELLGHKAEGNTDLTITVENLDVSNADNEDLRPLAKDAEIKAAIATAFGSHVDVNQVTITHKPDNNGTYVIKIPFKTFPGTSKRLVFNSLFKTTTSAPKVTAQFRFIPVFLTHRDSTSGSNRVGSDPIPGTQETVITSIPQQYILKEPTLNVAKEVTGRAFAIGPTSVGGQTRITGGDRIGYSVKLTNPSDVSAHNVKVTDLLPEAFRHEASLREVTVTPSTPATLAALTSLNEWALQADDREGVWPKNRVASIPPGATVTLNYDVNAPAMVTVDAPYTNTANVEYQSQTGVGLGIKNYNTSASAVVHGDAVNAVTTITPQQNLHGSNAVQHGELVTTTTKITIPNNVRIPNLSLLSTFAGADVDTTHASIAVVCPSGLVCGNTARLTNAGSDQVGFVVSDTEVANTTGQPVEMTVVIKNIVVSNGAGPVKATNTVYRSANTPSTVADLATGTVLKESADDAVTVQTPVLSFATSLVDGIDGAPIAQPIEPGTEGVFAKFELSNTSAGTKARTISLQVNDALARLGLKIDDANTTKQIPDGVNFDGTTLTLASLEGGDQGKKTIYLPVTWLPDAFAGAGRMNGETSSAFTVKGQTGPSDHLPTPTDAATRGRDLEVNAQTSLTPVYPTFTVTSEVLGNDGQPAATNDVVAGKPFKIKLSPALTGASGHNLAICINPKKVGAAPLDIALDNPAAGVAIDPAGTACAPGEVQINLPNANPNTPISPITLLVTPTDTNVPVAFDQTLGVTVMGDSKLGAAAGTPGPREFSAAVDQPITINPDTNLQVGVTWSKAGAGAADGQSTFNDYDTVENPVSATINITNTGTSPIPGANAKVRLVIPNGWTVVPPADAKGWDCTVADEAGTNVLTCARTDELAGNDPFSVTVQSPTGAFIPSGDLKIHGANPGDLPAQGGTTPVSPIRAEATVFIPKPDLKTTMTFAHAGLAADSLTKKGTVKVTNTGDAIRAGEAAIILSAPASGQPIRVTNANGWQCAEVGGDMMCTFPGEVAKGTTLPEISIEVDAPNETTPVEVKANADWMRIIPNAPSVLVNDLDENNDKSTTNLVPFNAWIDAKVNVNFANPTPGTGVESNPTITITNEGGGAPLPNGTKVRVQVPKGVQVADSDHTTGCVLDPAASSLLVDVYTCDITGNPTPGTPLNGPVVTGVIGPNKVVEVELILPGGPVSDPATGNNKVVNQTRTYTPPPSSPGPAPAPIDPKPSAVPTPIPTKDPLPLASDRPSNHPRPPARPENTAPVNPGRGETITKAEDRAESWSEAVIASGDRVPVVLIGRDNVFADSLSSGGLQGILNAPLLLNPVTELTPSTKESLDRMQPEQVILMGGPQAISVKVEEELKGLGWNVSRVHGPTRVETALDAAGTHAKTATRGVLARAYAEDGGSGTQAFADALSGGALAARLEIPVFLTTTDTLPDTVRNYLKESRISHLTLMGSTAAISASVEAQLHDMGITTTRIGGSNRAQTSVNAARSLGYWNASEAESVLVVNGESEDAWTDAFPAALYAKLYELPVVLSGSNTLLPETSSWLTPGIESNPPTRVICGYSVGNGVKECSFSPAALRNE